MAETMDYMPAFRMPARWPSMVGALEAPPADQPLRVQVCLDCAAARSVECQLCLVSQLSIVGALEAPPVDQPLRVQVHLY